jgi:SAM-dependent methyltransferase
VGRTGRVAGIDINAAMLGVARSLPAGAGAGIGWVQGSVLSLPVADASHDVVLCQVGLQFVPDRSAALAQMRRVLVPGGRLGVSVHGPIEHNPAAFALAQALDRHLGPDAPVIKRAGHALADAALLRTLAGEAGFQRIKIVTETRTVRFACVFDYVRIQLMATPWRAHPGEGPVPGPLPLAAGVRAQAGQLPRPHPRLAGGLCHGVFCLACCWALMAC